MQQELTGCQFADERLGKRFSMVLKQLAEGYSAGVPRLGEHEGGVSLLRERARE